MVTRWDVERAVTGSNIDSRGRLIVLALLTKANNDTARTTPEHTPAFSTLCAMTGLSKAVVSEWLQALEDGNWVTRINPSAGGKGNRTLYEMRIGDDKIERRSRDLRKPRKSANSSLGEPFEEVQTVRPANPLVPKQFAQRTPNSSPSEPFEASNSSPGERATTSRTTKNHQGAQSATSQPKLPFPSAGSSVRSWAASNEQPRTEGARIPRQPSLTDVRRAEVERLLEAPKIIGRWLHANGYPNASGADASAVHLAVIAKYPDKKITAQYLAGIASGSGFAQFYQPLIEARRDDIEKQIRALTQGQAGCEHGQPGGSIAHPTTGLPLCPLCKNGTPAGVTRLTETTHPDVQETLDAYRDAYRRSYGTGPLLPLLMTVTAEAETLRQNGVAVDQLTSIADRAGRHGAALLETARTLKGQAA